MHFEINKIYLGASQGSIILPLKYLLYVNDIFNVVDVNIIECVLHTDDIALIISANSIDELF